MGAFVVADNGTSLESLGFLTVVEHPQRGLFGGYLVLNAFARPLEFHCTAPIQANRAQQILYGPTLDSFLYGEQIGRTLLEKTKTKPQIVCTDRRAAMAVREHVPMPVALVLGADGASEETPNSGIELSFFELGSRRLAVDGRGDDDRRQVAERLECLAESFDLAEPFVRIREAIEEAQQGIRS